MAGWIPNTNDRIPYLPDEGDLIQVKHENGYSYLLKLIALSVDGDVVSGVVESIFDWDMKGQVRLGDLYKLDGMYVKIPLEYIHSVIRGS